ncbi:hypothetical protein Tco_1417665 [Tanacetum coccineum]
MEVLVRCWNDGDVVVRSCLSNLVDLTGDEDPTDEDGDIGMDGGKIGGGSIGAYGERGGSLATALYACIYGSS